MCRNSTQQDQCGNEFHPYRPRRATAITNPILHQNHPDLVHSRHGEGRGRGGGEGSGGGAEQGGSRDLSAVDGPAAEQPQRDKSGRTKDLHGGTGCRLRNVDDGTGCEV